MLLLTQLPLLQQQSFAEVSSAVLPCGVGG
jgi:hypothetical protein